MTRQEHMKHREAAKALRQSIGLTNRPTVADLVLFLRQLSPAARVDVFHRFCTHCGDENPQCQCWNDE